MFIFILYFSAFYAFSYGWAPKRNDEGLEMPNCNYEDTSCNISISNIDEDMDCKLQRIKDIVISRKFYKLTTLGEKKIIEFPLDFVPFLNQTQTSVKVQAAISQWDSRWLSLAGVLSEVTARMAEGLLAKFSSSGFLTANDYTNAFYMHNIMIQNLKMQNVFSNPAMYPSFTDLIYNHRYLTDDVFVQKRFAGPCPFLIKLVTNDGDVGFSWSKLKERLNPHFDFDSSLEKATGEMGITMEEAVKLQTLYVLYHETYNGLKTFPDYFGRGNGNDHRLYNVTSPIAIFARKSSGEVVVVAIQLNYLPTSTVYTPETDTFLWLFAKSMVNSADINVCNAIWHLSHIHLSSTVYCAIFRSHFSKLHPVYQIMRYHCEGTTPHIALTYKSLLWPQSFGRKMFTISTAGYADLAVKGYKSFKYGVLAFDNVLHKNGLDLNKLKYYPFRDDGMVIWSALKGFSNQFVNIYYKSDLDVKQDKELQSFADQVSIDGKGDPYGGKGNIVGFPSTFEGKEEVKTFITRFLWQIAMHSVVNYPLEPHGTFIPLAPTKFYNYNTGNTEDDNIYSALPDRRTTVATIQFTSLLGNMRINRIFDYYDKIKDNTLSELVKKFHFRFHVCIQDLLEKRNAKRKQNQQMGFQYLEPKWMPGSVHI